jgi:acylphosphatase
VAQAMSSETAAERVTRRFIITGKVQGVYFRHSTRLEAERLAVGGVARNLEDGSVEVIACGSVAAVQELSEWLRRGPPMARVLGVQELELRSVDRELVGEGKPPAAFWTE